MNHQAINKAVNGLKEIVHPAEWANAELDAVVKIDAPTLSRRPDAAARDAEQRPVVLEVCCRLPRPAGHDEEREVHLNIMAYWRLLEEERLRRRALINARYRQRQEENYVVSVRALRFPSVLQDLDP